MGIPDIGNIGESISPQRYTMEISSREKQRFLPVHNNVVYTLEGPTNKHPRAQFTEVCSTKSHYVVNNEWMSEPFNKPDHPGRAYPPWAFEFPGARKWHGKTRFEAKEEKK